jgi:hypothetical protein
MSQMAVDAIKAHCFWCKGKHGLNGRVLTDACEVTWCALWEFRPRLRDDVHQRLAERAQGRRHISEESA